MSKGYPKYKFLNYKPTQNDTCHVQSLKIDFYIGAFSSFDCVFTHKPCNLL